MNRKGIFFGVLFGALVGFSSCVDEKMTGDIPSTEQTVKTGKLSLSLLADNGFNKASRAVNESSYANVNDYTVEIYDAQNTKVWTGKGSEVTGQLPLTLPIGSVSVKAFYGTERAYSREGFYMYGETNGLIEPDGETTIAVNCKPTCGKVAFRFDEKMDDYFESYSVEFGGTVALGGETLSWTTADHDPYYMALTDNANGEEVSYTITLTAKDEYVHVANGERSKTAQVTGKFPLKRKDFYSMRITPDYSAPNTGTFEITITVDASTNDKEVSWTVPIDWI